MLGSKVAGSWGGDNENRKRCLGHLADHTSIGFVYTVCSFLPLLGLLTAFLPNLDRPRRVG